MKKALLLILFFSINSYAQVGIGTTNPLADLHIAGDAIVQDEFSIGSLEVVTATEENFLLATRVTNSNPIGEITALNVNAIDVAPINTVDYHFTNISLDNLTDLDLQYDESRYVVAISNFRYEGDAIKKVVESGNKISIGHFVVRTFISGGTWHLEIRNRSLDLDLGDSVDYYATLVIYDKSYYRYLPPITTVLAGNNTGTASSIPILN